MGNLTTLREVTGHEDCPIQFTSTFDSYEEQK